MSKVTAQVAVEAVLSWVEDGALDPSNPHDAATIETVRKDAQALGVSSFYLDLLPTTAQEG